MSKDAERYRKYINRPDIFRKPELPRGKLTELTAAPGEHLYAVQHLNHPWDALIRLHATESGSVNASAYRMDRPIMETILSFPGGEEIFSRVLSIRLGEISPEELDQRLDRANAALDAVGPLEIVDIPDGSGRRIIAHVLEQNPENLEGQYPMQPTVECGDLILIPYANAKDGSGVLLRYDTDAVREVDAEVTTFLRHLFAGPQSMTDLKEPGEIYFDRLAAIYNLPVSDPSMQRIIQDTKVLLQLLGYRLLTLTEGDALFSELEKPCGYKIASNAQVHDM